MTNETLLEDSTAQSGIDVEAPDTDLDPAFPEPDRDYEISGPYRMKPGHSFAYHGDKGEQPLTNFTARILDDVITEVGDVRHRHHEVEAYINGRVINFSIPAHELNGLSWVARELGGEAVVEPGAAKHVGPAIRRFSGRIPESRLVQHTGWTLDGGAPVFINAGKPIAVGESEVAADLPDELLGYRMNARADEDTVRSAIRASLSMLEVGEPEVMVPLVGGVYRSVLGPTDMAIHLVGETGTFKSTLAGLVMTHFGHTFDRTNLPASWSSTANALEALAWHAKDVLLAIDDYVPTEDNAPAKAARLFRAQGNGNGRSRLAGGTRVQTSRYPRGLILSTGEAVPETRSVRARLIVTQVADNVINQHRLIKAQQNGKQGLHVLAMNNFIRWLAEHHDAVAGSLDADLDRRRQVFELPGQHKRASTNAAQLMLGFDWCLRFATEQKAIRRRTADAIENQCRDALIAVTIAQRDFQHGGATEVDKFISLLRTVFHLKRGHVESMKSHCPGIGWGWKLRDSWRGHTPCGPHLGWLDTGPATTPTDLYLLPDLAYRQCQQVAPTTEVTL